MINLDASAFAKKILESDVICLDVRTIEEFNENHILNAMNLDIQSDYFDADIHTLDRSKSYAVYCRSGMRSVLASQELDKIGISSIYNLSGGILEWMESGQTTVN